MTLRTRDDAGNRKFDNGQSADGITLLANNETVSKGMDYIKRTHPYQVLYNDKRSVTHLLNMPVLTLSTLKTWRDPAIGHLTPSHLWHSRGPSLLRRHLETNVEETVHVFPTNIWDIQTNDTRVIVETEGNTLWIYKSKWKAFTTNVRTWVLTPNRVVYDPKGAIMTWNFTGAPRFITHGDLQSASDHRFIYEDVHGNRFWQDGTSTGQVAHVEINDTISDWDWNTDGDETSDVDETSEPYRLINGHLAIQIQCDSRTSVRLERLLGRERASQLLTHV